MARCIGKSPEVYAVLASPDLMLLSCCAFLMPRVRPEFAVALKYSAKQGSRRDADRVLLNCAVCDCDSAPYRLTFSCSSLDAQEDVEDSSVFAVMARMSARCLEVLVGLQQSLVQSDGQISGAVRWLSLLPYSFVVFNDERVRCR
jgi:hypothetical protein